MAEAVPHVTRIVDEKGREGFVIYDERYVSFVRRAEHEARRGYMGTEQHIVFSREGVQQQLASVFGLKEDDVEATLRGAPSVRGVIHFNDDTGAV